MRKFYATSAATANAAADGAGQPAAGFQVQSGGSRLAPVSL